MTGNPVSKALENLKEILFKAMPPDASMSHSVEHSIVSYRTIQSIHPGDAPRMQEATGGQFSMGFPAPAGREAARLMEEIIKQAFPGLQWHEMKQAFPGYVYERNPIRAKNDLDPNGGMVMFVVTDENAGLLARKLNELAEKIKQHSKTIAGVIATAEKYGPGLQQNGVGALFPLANNLMEKQPDIVLRLDIANHQTSLQAQLERRGLRKGAPSIITSRSGDQKIPATAFFATVDQMPAVDQILGDISQGRRPG